MLFADNFEDVEAIATYDVLTRGKEEVDAVSMMPTKEVKAKCGHLVKVSKHISEIDYTKYDCLIIPGGPASFTILSEMELVNEIITYFVKANKLVAAICAAPFLIGRLGYLKNENWTVHPGFESYIIGGANHQEEGVVASGNFITAKSMYYSIEFALKIYEHFHNKDKRIILEESLKGNK